MRITKITAAAFLTAAGAFAAGADIYDSRREIKLLDDGRVAVEIDFRLDSLHMGANDQLFISPVLEDTAGNSAVLPALLVSGRNMHYAWERGTVKRGGPTGYEVYSEVRRRNGRPQSVSYSVTTPCESWMMAPSARLTLIGDSCGCGREAGRRAGEPVALGLTPEVLAVYKTPEVTELPVSIHEGRARVQFEVDRTELHDGPYVCRNGQRIDNSSQLRVIDDSVRYALSDPNVELASISITGYASPESPYLHNERLSTDRSRALAEYLAARYNLPKEKCTYGAVAENWKEFREMAATSGEISESARRELLELIDKPCYGPADYDDKERILKTDKRFASLYRSLILPKWFPRLRATEFAISTRLRPLSDEALAEVIRKTPELMSLNQMMRVARLYPEGSDDFNRVIETALARYPSDPDANLNAAVAALAAGDNERAADLLKRAGDSAEAENARGVLATRSGDFSTAVSHFINAAGLPQADANLKALRPVAGNAAEGSMR